MSSPFRVTIEPPGALIEDRDPRNVRRHDVRRALDTPEVEVERARDGTRERGLPHSGNVVEQDMALDEQRGEQLLDRLVRADHHAPDLRDEALGGVLDPRAQLVLTLRPPAMRVETRRHHFRRGSCWPSRGRGRAR